jgi:hypothetical protein
VKRALHVCAVLALGAAAALLVACGSSGSQLIAASEAGPLQSDIEAVEQAAESGNGNCQATESALLKTEQDFAALPSTINTGLHNRLRLGIENLHKVATEACAQPVAKTTTTATTTTSTTKTSTTPPTNTETTTTPVTPSPPAEGSEESGAGGGTAAPGEGNGAPPGESSGGAAPEEGVAKGEAPK